MIKTAILVSGGGIMLQSIIDSRLFGSLDDCSLELVLSSHEDAYALQRAKNADIPTAVVTADHHPNHQSYIQAVCDQLTERSIELVVLAGFEHSLTASFIGTFPGRIIGTKQSLLPMFAELDALQAQAAALEAGMRITGATSCFVEGVDGGGPIIDQRVVSITADDTAETLSRRILEEAESDLLAEAVSLYAEGKLSVADGKVTIAP